MKKSDLGGNEITIFHAPDSPGLVIPDDVIKVQSRKRPHGSTLLTRRTNGEWVSGQYDDPNIAPIRVEHIGRFVAGFMREQGEAGLAIDPHAPYEIQQTVLAVKQVLGSGAPLDQIGVLSFVQPDDVPWRGQYL